MGKQLLTPLRLFARMNFSLKNYSCESFNLTGSVGIVELISIFSTVVCESWNVSDKYTWDNVGDHKQLSMDQTLSEDNGVIKRQFFHMVTHVFDSSNLSQEIFAIDTWAVICSLGHGRKHMLTILPTIWRPGLMSILVSRQITNPKVENGGNNTADSVCLRRIKPVVAVCMEITYYFIYRPQG